MSMGIMYHLLRSSRRTPYGRAPLTENPDVRLWLVDVPLAEHAPSRSRRAAFLHRAPHVTNDLTSL